MVIRSWQHYSSSNNISELEIEASFQTLCIHGMIMFDIASCHTKVDIGHIRSAEPFAD